MVARCGAGGHNVGVGRQIPTNVVPTRQKYRQYRADTDTTLSVTVVIVGICRSDNDMSVFSYRGSGRLLTIFTIRAKYNQLYIERER
jgi:hypothetical protein